MNIAVLATSGTTVVSHSTDYPNHSLHVKFVFLLVQRLKYDAVTDLTSETWSNVRLKILNKTIYIVSTSDTPTLQKSDSKF
ncbi:hypothetical protein J6590_036676 [Homalodisca vitripennis]|nr:hypothetical protein J6590_036676 [Homalodisca vitripennis]